MSTFHKYSQRETGSQRRISDSKMEKTEHIESSDEVASLGKVDATANIENIVVNVDNIPVSWFCLAGGSHCVDGRHALWLRHGHYLGDDLNGRPVTSKEKELITALVFWRSDLWCYLCWEYCRQGESVSYHLGPT